MGCSICHIAEVTGSIPVAPTKSPLLSAYYKPHSKRDFKQRSTRCSCAARKQAICPIYITTGKVFILTVVGQMSDNCGRACGFASEPLALYRWAPCFFSTNEMPSSGAELRPELPHLAPNLNSPSQTRISLIGLVRSDIPICGIFSQKRTTARACRNNPEHAEYPPN